MNIKKLFTVIVFICVNVVFGRAQIMLSPVIDATVGGLDQNNREILEARLRNVISSNGMVSGYGGRFVLACKVSLLGSEVAGSKLAQNLQVSFAIGDNPANVCYGSTSIECVGIGNTEAQALTSAIRNIKGTNPELKKIVAQSHDRILSYYDKNAPTIIKKAESLIARQDWEQALYELTAIPQECKYYPQALKLLTKVYKNQLNHDASQQLAEAQALWAADPNPGEAADQALTLLGQINTSASCYKKAQTLINQIKARTKQVTDRDNKEEQKQAAHEREMDKRRIAAEEAVAKVRATACRDAAVAWAKKNVNVSNHYHGWF